MTALHHAAHGGHRDTVELLLSVSEIDANAVAAESFCETALHVASKRGHRDVVERLLAVPNINVTATDFRGWTALHCGAAGGHCDVVGLLASVPGVDVNTRQDGSFGTPRTAIEEGHRYLDSTNLDNYFSYWRARSHSETVLHIACEEGHRGTVELLLSVPNIDMNATDSRGWTALHYAATRGHHDIVEFLIRVRGMDLDCVNEGGKTALDIAHACAMLRINTHTV